MTVGTQTNAGNVNGSLSALAVAWRDLATQTLDQLAYLNQLGLDGLEALGFSSDDGSAVLQATDYMGTCAQVYRGDRHARQHDQL